LRSPGGEAEAVLRQARAALFPEITRRPAAQPHGVSSLTAPPPVGGFPVRADTRLFASTNFESICGGRLDRASEAARRACRQPLRQRRRDPVAGQPDAQTYFGLRSLDAQLAVLRKIRTRAIGRAGARPARRGARFELDLYQAQRRCPMRWCRDATTSDARALLEHQLGQLVGELDSKAGGGDLFALPVRRSPPVGLPSMLLERVRTSAPRSRR